MEQVIEGAGLATETDLAARVQGAITQAIRIDFNRGVGAGRGIQQHHVDHLTRTPYVQFFRRAAYDFDVINLIR